MKLYVDVCYDVELNAKYCILIKKHNSKWRHKFKLENKK